MRQSNIGSWQTKNNMKGNHCRKSKLANLYLGVIGNTYNTPLFINEELLMGWMSRVNSTTFIIVNDKGAMKMNKLTKLLTATTLAFSLVGCGQNEEVKEDNQFVVGMECAYAPFNWQESSASDLNVSLGNAGYANGYDVQIAKLIAEALGQELVIKKISWDGLGPAVEAGEIDAIIAGMTKDATREEGLDFTTPYYDSEGMIMIVRKDSKQAKFTDIQQFSGQNIVGQKGTNYDTVIDQIKGVNHVVPKQTYPEMVVALQAGDVDGITAEMCVAEGVLAANPDLTVVKFDEGKGFDIDTTVSIGLKEGSRDSEFFNAVQSALDSINKETRNKLMKEAVANQPTED